MGTVVGKWRLNLIIFMTVFLTCLYIGNGMFMGIENETYQFEMDKEEEVSTVYTGESDNSNIQDITYSWADYLSFGNIDNAEARVFLNILVWICGIITIYLAYTFIKEWIPLT